jgi:hypothetical protein
VRRNHMVLLLPVTATVCNCPLTTQLPTECPFLLLQINRPHALKMH